MNPVFTLIAALLLAPLVALPSPIEAQTAPPAPAGTRFLLLDSRRVAHSENARLSIGTIKKHEDNPLFGEDKPWEKRFDNFYGNVILDTEAGLYKCWYDPFIVDLSAKGMTLEQRKQRYVPPKDREMGICYAISKDGIHWEKPNLGKVDYEGSKDNNILVRGPHGAGVFKDEQERNPLLRYKMIFAGLFYKTSADGITWSQSQKLEGVQVAGDTHNNAFWAPTLHKYVAITRTWDKGLRQVARIESDDFTHWSPVDMVLSPSTPELQPYAMPVFFHGGVYLGLVTIHAQPPIDRVWVELAWSPDTKQWHRISEGTPFIPCSNTPLEYDYGCVYPCANPVILPNEVRLYYGGSDYRHFGWRNGFLCLATLRPDGFAGYEPVNRNAPAVVITTVLDYPGQGLRISADVAQGGHIEVYIVNANGNVIAKAQSISKTVSDGRLTFPEPVPPGKIQLRFELTRAKLYSFSLGE